MKKYEITIRNAQGDPTHSDKIEANSPKEAYEKFVASNKPIPFSRIIINWGFSGAEGYDPPHYEGHVEEPENNQSGETKETEREIAVRSIGSTKEVTPSNEPSQQVIEKSVVRLEEKLDKLWRVMDHIRGIGISIAMMFALTFIVPQCSGS